MPNVFSNFNDLKELLRIFNNEDLEDSIETELISDEQTISDDRSNEKYFTVTAAATSAAPTLNQLTYFESMTAGAISRSIAQTLMHPANTYKTLLQLKVKRPKVITLPRLLRGADAQFLFSIPTGAFQFWVMETLKDHVSKFLPTKLAFVGDLTVSSLSTVICSIFSTPQMVVTDRIMAGVYPDSRTALSQIFKLEGLRGFYKGWAPALAQKIPSYALTWMFFQQMKRIHSDIFHKPTNGEENFVLGALAAAASVCVMIPMDTVKTRLVIQDSASTYYKGMGHCFMRIFKEEGLGAFYRSLGPRLMSVVPMIAIQFAVYEAIKSNYIQGHIADSRRILSAKLNRKSSLAGL